MKDKIDISRFMDGDKVKIWPSKRQFKLAVFEYLSSKFEMGRFYSEKQVNDIIDRYQSFGDHATIRRGLCDNSFLDRDGYGIKYWKLELTT